MTLIQPVANRCGFFCAWRQATVGDNGKKMASGVTRAMENKRIRQDALREQLAAGGHIEHVLDMASKISDLECDLDSAQVNRLKAACEIKLKLVDKYLPSLKAVDMSGDMTINVPQIIREKYVGAE